MANQSAREELRRLIQQHVDPQHRDHAIKLLDAITASAGGQVRHPPLLLFPGKIGGTGLGGMVLAAAPPPPRKLPHSRLFRGWSPAFMIGEGLPIFGRLGGVPGLGNCVVRFTWAAFVSLLVLAATAS